MSSNPGSIPHCPSSLQKIVLCLGSHHLTFVIYKMLEPEEGMSTLRVLKKPKIACARFVIKGMEGKGQN